MKTIERMAFVLTIVMLVVFHVTRFSVECAAWAFEPGSSEVDVALEKRLQVFAREVRCLVCQNETLADSQADLAEDLRREIREQMKAGRTDDQIKAFLTERYGDFVLYRPPIEPRTLPLWSGPFVLAAGGFWVLYRSLKGRGGGLPFSVGMDQRVTSSARRKQGDP